MLFRPAFIPMAVTHLRTSPVNIYEAFIRPRSIDQDARRREYILNVLLLGLAIVALVAFVTSVVEQLSKNVAHNNGSLATTVIFLVFTLALLWVSRRGWYAWAAYIFVTLLGGVATLLMLLWSFELPQAQLAYAVTIVVAGILLTARAAFTFAGVISALVLMSGYAQVNRLLHPSLSWLTKPFLFGDAVGYVAIFGLIGLVTWLSNREIDRSLLRARASEAALAEERDNLEVKVHERTRELEEMQLARALELQKFAEFGRLSAGLLHEVTNPLTAASLNLQQVDSRGQSEPLVQAVENLRQLERYVGAARMQLKREGTLTRFSIGDELKQVLNLLDHKARSAGVKIRVKQQGSYQLFGDPVKFNQLVANVVANAIEAYDEWAGMPEKRSIVITLTSDSSYVTMSVQDWGKGITREERKHLFEPFYSAKPATGKSLGIGLAMAHQFVTEDFRGTIKVTSTQNKGTQFVIKLRDHEKAAT